MQATWSRWHSAELFLVALGVFFPIYVNTLLGILTGDPHLIEMGRAYGMSNATLFRRVLLPGRCRRSSSAYATGSGSCG